MTLEIARPKPRNARPARRATRPKSPSARQGGQVGGGQGRTRRPPEKPARRKKDSAPAPREAAPREEIAREQPRHEETCRDRGQSNERRRDYRSEPPSARRMERSDPRLPARFRALNRPRRFHAARLS
jgi:hypothetical protein